MIIPFLDIEITISLKKIDTQKILPLKAFCLNNIKKFYRKIHLSFEDKVPFNGKARGYWPGSHMYLTSYNFRGFLFCGFRQFFLR